MRKEAKINPLVEAIVLIGMVFFPIALGLWLMIPLVFQF